jgi:hypothetical protein
MNRFLLFFVLFALSAAAMDDGFQLADPAAEILEEQNNPKEYAKPDDRLPGLDWVRKGVGDTACDDHLAFVLESPERYEWDLFWLQGFLDGVGYQRYITLGDYRLSPDYLPELMAAWIKDYCLENPTDDLAGAARAYLIKLNG